jgi:glycosyltransferase involved in cell wall biosynthesis
MVAMLCRELGGPPYSFTVHGPEEFDRAPRLALRDKVARAAFAVTVSHFGRSQLCRWSRYEDWSKLTVVRCGVDDRVLHAAPVPIPSELRLVCVARLGEQKGHPILIEAIARLRASGIEAELVLVGDGPLRSSLQALARSLGVEAQVKFAGWLNEKDVRAAIHRSRALVLPSFAEGLPVVLMEALALGRPIISTWVAGIPELVEHGVCGFLVPAASVEDLLAALRAVMEAPAAQLEAMGKAGMLRVAQMHDASVEAGKLAGLFRASLENPEGGGVRLSRGQEWPSKSITIHQNQ